MKVERSTLNWWLFIVSGAIAIVYGIFAMAVPAETMGVVMKWSGVVLAIIGVGSLSVALWRHRNMYPYATLLFYSIVMLLLGVAVIIWWRSAVKVLVMALGVWAVVSGLLQFFSVFKFKNMPGKWFYITSSLLSIVFGVLLLFNPFESVKVFVVLTGCLALFFGAIMIVFGIHLYKIAHSVEVVEEEPARADETNDTEEGESSEK